MMGNVESILETGESGETLPRLGAVPERMAMPPKRPPPLPSPLSGEVEVDARVVSRALPRAIALSTQMGSLGEPLTPAVEQALAVIGRRDNRTLARVLAPHMGRALMRALVDFLRDAIRRLNLFFLCDLSLRGWRWRVEAYRRGVPFQKIVSDRTMTTPIKQVFLIHRETGLLLQEMRSALVGMRDWDMVSGMLTALQDFVHDSFSLTESERLDTVRIGQYSVMIEHGAYASLAGVLEGEAHEELRERFRAALGEIHGAFPSALETFDGDVSVFEDARPFLERCLGALVSREHIPMLPQTWGALILPLVLLAVWGVPQLVEGWRWKAYVQALQEQPGLVVLESGRRNGRYHLSGLRDPSAESPYRLQRAMGLGELVVDARWESYQGLSAGTTLARAREMLSPPATVSMEVREGVLVLWGAAPMQWIERAETLLSGWTGAAAYNLDRLVPADLERAQKWKQYVERLMREPGIVVVREGSREGRFFIQGLRDPLAADPEAWLPRFGMTPEDVDGRWESYVAVNPALTLKRVRLLLRAPEGVELSLRGGVLHLAGTAPHRWIQDADLLARSVPGIEGVDRSALVDQDMEALRAVSRQIEAMHFRFLLGVPELWDGQGAKLNLFMERCRALRTSAARSRVPVVIEIRGHAVRVGAGETEVEVSEALARQFHQILQWQRMDLRDVVTVGMGSRPPSGGFPDPSEGNRVISFGVVVSDPVDP